MSIASELTGIVNAHTQAADAIQVRAILQRVRADLTAAKAEIENVVSSGNFDLIPGDTRAALSSGYTLINNGVSTLNSGDLGTVLDWSAEQ